MACSRSLLCARARPARARERAHSSGAPTASARLAEASARSTAPAESPVCRATSAAARWAHVRHRQLHGGGAPPCRPFGGPCPRGGVAREPAGGKELEGVGAEALGGRRHVGPAGGALEQLDRALVMADLVLGVGERERGPAADVAGLAVAG